MKNMLESIVLTTKIIRGTMLLDFITENQLCAMHSFFNKREQKNLTWMSSNEQIKNETDYFLFSNKSVITDIIALNCCNANSDCQKLHTKITINTKLERPQ